MNYLKNLSSCRWSGLVSSIEREMGVNFIPRFRQQINRPQNGVREREASDTTQFVIANNIICNWNHRFFDSFHPSSGPTTNKGRIAIVQLDGFNHVSNFTVSKIYWHSGFKFFIMNLLAIFGNKRMMVIEKRA